MINRDVLARRSFPVVLIVVLGCCAGCVQRRLMIQTNPEGALVTVDRQVVGHSPVSVPFTYYGTREIELQMDGFETTRVKQRIRPPWYEIFPLSLISENLAFREQRDVRVLDFTLAPKTPVQENHLLDRASQLRGDVYRGTVTGPVK